MDIVPTPSPDASSEEDSDASAHSSSAEDFTLVTGKKRLRKKQVNAGPSKAPKTAPRSPAATPRAPTPSSGAKTPPPPPLFIQDKSKWTAVSGWCNEHHIQFRSARTTQQGIKVQVTTSADHRALTRVLREKNVSFHTYTLPEERLLRVVIRGVPKELSTSDVKASLTSQNFPVHEVHRMVRARQHAPYDMVLVSLDHSEAGKAIFKATTVCHLSGITVEPPRKKGVISQCHRCQLYGHSARNCFARPRCVKCLEDHATADCKRPKDRALCEEPPACVLCGQVGHPANYRGCPKAPRPAKPSAPPRTVRSPPKPQPLVSPAARPCAWNMGALHSQSAFPSLPVVGQPPRAPVAPVRPPPPTKPKPQPRQALPVKPAPKVAQATTNSIPAPVPVLGATPNSPQAEDDFALVLRFAMAFDHTTLRQLAAEIKACRGNFMALAAVSAKYADAIEQLKSFNANP